MCGFVAHIGVWRCALLDGLAGGTRGVHQMKPNPIASNTYMPNLSSLVQLSKTA